MNLLSVLLLFFTVSSAFAQKCDCGSGPVVYYPDPQVDYPDPEVYYPDPEVYYPDPQVYYPDPQVYYPDPYVYTGPYRYRRELRRRKRCAFHCGPFGSG
ncbi:extensin-2-like isoform X1 [Drosophila subpulchrella]|uniref:extensin-2-like isoform X1 n=1 Tax=Drosophila subpulchrella TaxID=1486046 RepID=UPI0018A13A7E|nr:extensin-2-like isoform X1 [Drosophila subpulchrella]